MEDTWVADRVLGIDRSKTPKSCVKSVSGTSSAPAGDQPAQLKALHLLRPHCVPIIVGDDQSLLARVVSLHLTLHNEAVDTVHMC